MLSSSRAALGLTINMRELRSTHYLLQDLTEAEGEQLLAALCKPFVKRCTAEELSCFCRGVARARDAPPPLRPLPSRAADNGEKR